MKKILLLTLVSFLRGQLPGELFSLELRERVLTGNIVEVVVQVDNNTDLEISSLEGFITVREGKLKIIAEERLALVKSYERPLKPGLSASRSLNFTYDPSQSRRYEFHITRIQFTGDHRIYIYHPKVGLIRID